MSRKTILLAVLLSILLLIPSTGIVQPQSSFNISPTSPTTIPAEEATYDGNTKTFSSVTTVQPGGQITVETIGPDETGYIVNLAENENTVRRSTGAVGRDTVTMDVDDLPVGTYALAIDYNGSIRAIHPVVIQGYDIDQTSTLSASRGENLTASITITETRNNVETPSEVSVALWNGNTKREITANKISDKKYNITFPANDVEDGDNLIVQVYGSNTRFDTTELLAVDTLGPVTVTTPTETETPVATATESDKPASSGPSDGQGGPSVQPGTETTSATQTTTATDETPQTPENTLTTRPSVTESTEQSTIDSTEVQVSTRSTDQTADIPNQSNQSQEKTSEVPITTNQLSDTNDPDSQSTVAGDGPGMTLLQGVLAALLSIILLQRRQYS